MFFFCPQVITVGIVRGAGKQMLGAGCMLVCFYFVGFPIGVSLMFALKMGILGLWSGIFVCVFLQSLFFLIIIYKLDWKRATEEALKRAGVQTAEAKPESYALENMCVDEDVQRMESQPREGDQTDVAAKEENNEERSVENGVAVTVGDVLTTKQLVVRRGLAVLVMILILAAGITLNEILTGLMR
ncbi:multidrug and toxin extrusion protein 1 [Tachysurus ichikawai]